jgi:hypothetical protein
MMAANTTGGFPYTPQAKKNAVRGYGGTIVEYDPSARCSPEWLSAHGGRSGW